MSPAPVLALTLSPGNLRSTARIPALEVSSSTQQVRIDLLLLDDNFEHYRVALHDHQGNELWARPQLKPFSTSQGKSIIVNVPTEVLSAGENSLNLSGLSGSQEPENISSYHFRMIMR